MKKTIVTKAVVQFDHEEIEVLKKTQSIIQELTDVGIGSSFFEFPNNGFHFSDFDEFDSFLEECITNKCVDVR